MTGRLRALRAGLLLDVRELLVDPVARIARLQGLKETVTARDPGDWIDEQLADIKEKAGAKRA